MCHVLAVIAVTAGIVGAGKKRAASRDDALVADITDTSDESGADVSLLDGASGEDTSSTSSDTDAYDDLSGEIESLEATITSLEEELENLGGSNQVITNIQNVTYTTVVENIEKERELLKQRKEDELRKAVAAKKRSGTKGRASLITGSAGGIGYRSGLLDQSAETPSNIKVG